MIVDKAKSLFQLTESRALEIYQDIVAFGSKSDKKKLACIGSAIAMVIMAHFYRKIALPPKAIRCIPRVNFFSYMKSVLSNEDPIKQLRSLYAPLSAEGGGVYVRPHRVGWSVYVGNPTDAKKVYMKQDLFPKAPESFGEGDILINRMIRHPSILTENGSSWKVHRQAANPAFHKAMPVKIFGTLAQNFFKQIEIENGSINMSAYLKRYTFDAITTAGFGYNANAIGDKESEWVRLYTSLIDGIFDPFFFFFPIFDTKLRWMFPSRVKIHQNVDVFLSKIAEIIEDKRAAVASNSYANAADDNEKDLCTLMIEAEASLGGRLTNEEMMNDLLAFILAADDTTANALGSAMYFLAVNQDMQQKLREEAIAWLGDGVDVCPTVEQTKEMPYVNMVIKETLRIMAPAVQGQARIATEDTQLGAYFIPKGTIVSVDIVGLQHDASIWEDPYKFNPERFSRERENNTKRNGGWMPFGSGMNMSLAEQRVLLSMMAKKFQWCLPKDSIHQDGMSVEGIDVIGPKDLVLKFEKRY
ncbi:hypothetical protein HMPREF1544_10309 [Mucor circinelloides 1006PhL]|uniref:Cytochrome P450 n=1 Tax=Mucor circinelloides f. circinelloides (strain 1006PhL) TaxID=1220926 RepID=S2J069_MUCC1|nr:hypothetical protein HMPREF1544_10309 [Mucor circinelloides 1006PhL]